MAHKRGKINTSPSEEYKLLRNNLETLDQSKSFAKRKNKHDKKRTESDARARENDTKRITTNSRAPKFSQFCSSTGPTQTSTNVNVSKYYTKTITQSLPSTTECVQRTELVDSELPVNNTITLPPSSELSSNRCIRRGMGSTNKQSSFLGQLFLRGKTSTFQSERAVSHTTCSSESGSFLAGQLSPNTMRQQGSSRSVTERRRYEIQ
ncbi:unnamed protein product, partial [Brenthis ino]